MDTIHYVAQWSISGYLDQAENTFDSYRKCFNYLIAKYELSYSAAKTLRLNSNVRIHDHNSNCSACEDTSLYYIAIYTCDCPNTESEHSCELY